MDRPFRLISGRNECSRQQDEAHAGLLEWLVHPQTRQLSNCGTHQDEIQRGVGATPTC